MTASVLFMALDQSVWASPLMVLAGTIVTAGLGFMTAVIVKRMSRRGEDAVARRTEVEAEALAAQAADDDQDRDLSRMQKTLTMAFDALDRLNDQVSREREQRDAQFSKHVSASQQRMDELQAQSDRRHEFVMAEVQELRSELAGTRAKIRAHRPWDQQVTMILRDQYDSEFPDPPEL